MFLVIVKELNNMIASLPAEISKWVTLALIIVAVIFVIKVGMKLINILVMVVVLGFCWYTFFSEEGAARLSIALSGHPITAYTTKLDKQENISTSDTTYFTTSKDVVVAGTKVEYVKCYTKWIIRIPSVGEY